MTDQATLFDNQTQCQQLLAHFGDGGTLTTMEAYTKFGITQLARCLADLERQGHSFNRPRIKLASGKIVCRYSMVRN